MTNALSKDLPFDSVESDENKIESLTTYRLLGNTGLRVSPLAFGAGTFGGVWGDAWSSSKEQAQTIFSRYAPLMHSTVLFRSACNSSLTIYL